MSFKYVVAIIWPEFVVPLEAKLPVDKFLHLRTGTEVLPDPPMPP